jgi:phage head maturation protease
LFDVSPVTYPAYPDTTAAKRELSDIESKKAELEAEKERKVQAEKEAAEREAYLRDLDLQG